MTTRAADAAGQGGAAAALHSIAQGLSDVDLFGNHLGNEGTKAVAEVLLTNTTLERLDLRYNSIDDDGAEALAVAIGRNSCLQKINLSDNEIGDKGAKALAKALETNTTLQLLGLGNNNISDEGAMALACSLRQSTSLEWLFLRRNNIQSPGAKALAIALEANTSLRLLDLNTNNIGPEGHTSLANALKQNRRLQTLVIFSNNISTESAQALASALQCNHTLQELDHDIKDVRILAQIRASLARNKGGSPSAGPDLAPITDEEWRDAVGTAIAHGDSHPWGRAKLMIVGRGAAGKTSTVRSLLGQMPETAHLSTEVADIHRTRAMDWKSLESDQGEFDAQVRFAARQRLHASRTAAGNAAPDETPHLPDEKEPKIVAPAPSPATHTLAVADSPACSDVRHDQESESHTPTNHLPEPADVAQKFPMSEEDQALLQRSAPEGPKRDLSFTIWDYGGQQVFYALHHIFLTEKGLYLVVFDMREIIGKSEFETKLKPEELELLASREDAIRYLRFWLNSIKLHAPNAPILLVGTYLDQVKDLLKVERYLAAHKICAPGTLVIPPNGLRFFPVDNCSVDPERAAELRRAIVSTAAAQPYVNERVPLAWLKIYEELVASSEPYWLYSDLIQRASTHGQSRNETDDLVAYFHGLGVVVHLRTSPALERIVVLDPQWLLDKLSCVIADDLHAEKMFYDPQLRASGHIEAYERMRSSSIASHSILEWLWRKQEVPFLRDFMIANMLLSEWRFDEDAEEDEFLVTGLLSGMTEPLETPHFEPGLSCILSFEKFFLPNGVFHRLVAQCAEYASRDDVAGDDEPMTPRQNNAQAIMSFGANDFLLTVRGNVIHICIDKRADQPALVIKLLVSMFREQKDTIFRKLPWELLLVSPTSQVSISHGKLAKAHQAGNLQRRLRDPSGGRTAYVSEFDAFFREDLGALDGDGDGKQVSSPVPVSPLGPDEDTHVFISHVQATGGDLSDALRCKLENRGLKVWFDQAHEGNLNRAAMLAAVRRARTYVLVLTKGIFASEAVKDELRCAFDANKPIVPVHENETHRLSYATFSEYIATAPSFCSGIFLEEESLPVRRKWYEENSFLKELIRRCVQGKQQKNGGAYDSGMSQFDQMK